MTHMDTDLKPVAQMIDDRNMQFFEVLFGGLELFE